MKILNNKEIKAQKEHKCNFCGGIINKGTVYKKTVIVNEDGLYTWKSHPSCSKMVSKLDMNYDDEGVTSEYFAECIMDEYSNIISEMNKEKSDKEKVNKPEFLDCLKIVKEAFNVSLVNE